MKYLKNPKDAALNSPEGSRCMVKKQARIRRPFRTSDA